jgi:hypothetical protein
MLKLLRVRHLLAVLAILCAMGAAYHAMHTTQGVMSVAREEGTLVSAEYRAPIARLEAQLFAPGPLTMEQRIQLAAAFDDVRKSLASGSGTHMSQYSARELGTLAAMCRGLGDLGGADLDRVRQNWMRVRSNTFDDASWFRFSEADPVAPPVEPRTLLSADDRARVERLRSVLDRIQAQIDHGQQEADRLGEPQPDGTVEGWVGDAWRNWVPGWSDEVSRLHDSLPSSPDATTSMRVRFAWDSANRALDELAAVPGSASSGGRPPYKFEWTRHFQNAGREVAAARGWIEKAEQGRDV